MSNTPLVSVIIPVYNCKRFIEEAVESALEQDYANKEVIVIDDGSTDGTLDILRAYGDRIRLIAQKNAGPPAARNNALRAVRGDCVAFLDADDVWAQGKLTAQVAHLEANPDVGTVLTHWHIWPAEADGSFRRPDFFAKPIGSSQADERYSGWMYNRLLFDCELLTTTVMMRTRVAREIGEFDVTLYNGDDYDYWIRASRIAKVSRLKDVGALYRVVQGSVSRKPQERNFEYEVIQKALSRWGMVGPDGATSDAAAINSRLERLVMGHAYDHLLRGNPKVALAGYWDMVRKHPANAKLWLKLGQAMWKVRTNSGVMPVR